MSEEEEIEDYEFDFEPYSAHENIAAAFNAMTAIDTLDEGLMKPSERNRLKQIRRKSLLIIHKCIGEIYDMVFEQNENEDDEL